jgi:hypothetical protein
MMKAKINPATISMSDLNVIVLFRIIIAFLSVFLGSGVKFPETLNYHLK